MAHPAPWDGQVPCHEYPEHGIVWVEVPKAASTTIKLALANALMGGHFTDDHGLHDWVGWTWARNLGQLHEWLAGRWRDWWRFAVLRDPIDRFASLYREKIDPGALGDMGTWVAANADSFWWEDIHAVPQARIVGDLTAYDHVGRVDQLDETARLLSLRVGRPVTFGHHNATTPRDPVTPGTRVLLERRYHEDLQALATAELVAA